jgi:hypothetical protein
VLTNYTIEPCFTLTLVTTPPFSGVRTHCVLASGCTQKKIWQSQSGHNQRMSTPTRFELARAEPIGFQNQLLNHSDTVSPAWGRWAVVPHRQTKKRRHRRDLNSRGQSPVDFESTSLTTRTRCLGRTQLCHGKFSEPAKVTGAVGRRFLGQHNKAKKVVTNDSESKFRSWDL